MLSQSMQEPGPMCCLSWCTQCIRALQHARLHSERYAQVRERVLCAGCCLEMRSYIHCVACSSDQRVWESADPLCSPLRPRPHAPPRPCAPVPPCQAKESLLAAWSPLGAGCPARVGSNSMWAPTPLRFRASVPSRTPCWLVAQLHLPRAQHMSVATVCGPWRPCPPGALCKAELPTCWLVSSSCHLPSTCQ